LKKRGKKPATVGPTSHSNCRKCLFCDSLEIRVTKHVSQNANFLVVTPPRRQKTESVERKGNKRSQQQPLKYHPLKNLQLKQLPRGKNMGTKIQTQIAPTPVLEIMSQR